jgi:hypothetical protein
VIAFEPKLQDARPIPDLRRNSELRKCIFDVRPQHKNSSWRTDMKALALAAVVGATVLTGATTPSFASVEYPWCIITGGGRGGGAMSCGYVSFAQCMQTRIGTDMCVENPRYFGPRR